MSNRKRSRAKPTIGRQAQDRIGRDLRAMYSEVLHEPLPAEMLAVLQALDSAETAQLGVRHAVEKMWSANRSASFTRNHVCGASPVQAQQTFIALAMGQQRRSRPRRGAGKAVARPDVAVGRRLASRTAP